MTGDRWPWPRWPYLVALVLIAVIFRVALILTWPQHIAGTDASQYLTLARNLAEGREYSLWKTPPFDPDVYRSPGYPLFIALFLKSGLGLLSILAAQVILEFTSVFLAAAVIGRLASRRAARIALILGLLCPFTAAIPCLFLSESLCLPLITLLVALAPAARCVRGAIAYGLTLGFLVATRGNFLPAIPLAGLIVLVSGIRHLTPDGRRFFWREAFCLCAAACLVLAPYGAWNASRHGRISVTPLAGMGRALWGGVGLMPGLPLLPPPEPAWTVHNAIWGDGTLRPSPKELVAADLTMKRVALTAIRENPSEYMIGVLRQAGHIWIGERYLFPFNNPGRFGLLWRALSVGFLIAGVGGAWRLRAPIATRLLMILPALTLTVTLPWLYVNMRYTSVTFGAWAILAGVGFATSRFPFGRAGTS